MNIAGLASSIDVDKVAHDAITLMEDLFPHCRSITGNGLRASLSRIGQEVPLEVTEVPSGTQVFDWTIPLEWNVNDAWVADASGRRVVDFRASNLHVLNYSTPINARLQLDELRPHLHTLAEHPGWIPYRTSYYAESWGFCLTHDVMESLAPGEYDAVIDTTLEAGSLTYGECYLPGTSDSEVLISSHVCHPSLANDNLSGVVVAAMFAKLLAGTDHRLSYRFVFAPGTIGALAWLAGHEGDLHRIRAGLVLACVGDDAPLVYKRSRIGDAEIDRAMEHVLRHHSDDDEIEDFSPYGNDERQYCSPGFNLPVGALLRSGHDRNVRHHTSADDLASISAASLADAVSALVSVATVLESNAIARSRNPKGEPQLGRRGLFRAFGGRAEQQALESALLWVMNLADGRHSLLDIARRSDLPFSVITEAAGVLVNADLLDLEPITTPHTQTTEVTP